jgi:hypothetical protein
MIIRSKVKKSIISDFRSHDQSWVYKNVHEIKTLTCIIFDFRSHEKCSDLEIEFRSPDKNNFQSLEI